MFDGSEHRTSIFSNYLSYVEETEPPIIYHRWCWLTSLSACIGKKAYIDQGHFRVFPNLYVMLLGEPAARKSTSIKLVKKLLTAAGYSTFAADKTSKEKFLLDLEGVTEDEVIGGSQGIKNTARQSKYDLVTADNLWGTSTDGEPREMFIVADEFNEFAGTGNLDFFTTLGNLWDFDSPNQPFTQRLKNSRSVSIYQPTITLLSGNTPELFSRAFPPEAIGSGFLSRLLLIHGERSGRKITFPPPPDAILSESLIKYLQQLILFTPERLSTSFGALDMLDKIYQTEESATDMRFRAYNNRRFTQLLKLCVILTCGKFKQTVGAEEVLEANTILSHAELLMPKAMGEFGKSKNSDVANKIMETVEAATKPVSTREIWGAIGGVSSLPAQKDLVDLLNGLVAADKLQLITGHGTSGFLPKKKPRKEPLFVDWSLLTTEERNSL